MSYNRKMNRPKENRSTNSQETN